MKKDERVEMIKNLNDRLKKIRLTKDYDIMGIKKICDFINCDSDGWDGWAPCKNCPFKNKGALNRVTSMFDEILKRNGV